MGDEDMFERLINRAAIALLSLTAPTLKDLNHQTKAEAWRGSMRRLARFTRVASGVSEHVIAEPKGAWFVPDKCRDAGSRLLYIHGGAFISGTIKSHRGFASALAKTLKIPVFLPSYRLAPENRYPAALDDVLEAYDYVTRSGPDGDSVARHVTVAGDSAGGNLALALHHRLTDEGTAVADAMLVCSPMTDMTHSLPSWTERADVDAMLRPGITDDLNDEYVPIGTTKEDKRHPYLSPLFGDFSNSPPTIIFVGGRERLYDDSVHLARQLQEAGIDVECHEEGELFHDWPLFVPILPAANRAQFTILRWYDRIRKGANG